MIFHPDAGEQTLARKGGRIAPEPADGVPSSLRFRPYILTTVTLAAAATSALDEVAAAGEVGLTVGEEVVGQGGRLRAGIIVF